MLACRQLGHVVSEALAAVVAATVVSATGGGIDCCFMVSGTIFTDAAAAGGFFSEKPIDENATKLQFHITSLVQGTATVGWNDCMLVDVLIRYVLLVN